MKYNLSEIMKRAWEVVKKAGTSFAAALKFSWACAKKAREIKEKEHYENENCKVSFLPIFYLLLFSSIVNTFQRCNFGHFFPKKFYFVKIV